MTHTEELFASKLLFGMVFDKSNKPDDIIINWGRVTYFDTSDNNFNIHRHFCFELHLCLEGMIRIFVGDKMFELTKNTFIIIPPTVSHRVEFVSENFVRFGCGFSISDNSDMKSIIENKELSVRGIPDYVKYQVDYILSKVLEKSPYREKNVGNQIVCIITDAIERIITVPVEKEEKNDMLILSQHVRQFIEDNVCVYVNPEHVAHYSGYSLRHLNRIMKSTDQKTVMEIIDEVKLKKATQLLSDPDFTVAKISEMLGYESINTLTNKFKKKYGKTPSEYRKKLLKTLLD